MRFAAQLALEGRAEVLVVVDNDLALPIGALEALVATFLASGSQVVGATKAPLVGRHSSEFQKLYSYAVEQSFSHGIFPKRPTGSFYGIDPSVVDEIFPFDSDEGNLLARAHAAKSGVVVRSNYAPSFDLEVARRVRHEVASNLIGIRRLHADPVFVSEAKLVKLPDAVDARRFVASLNVWEAVHKQATTTCRVNNGRQS